MKKRIISIVAAIALIVTSIGAYVMLNKEDSYVFAAEFRSGYVIEPTDIDETGVAVTSDFEFKWNDEGTAVTSEELQEGLLVSPEMSFTIKEGEEGFIIDPVNPLEKNTIYVFDFKGITWVYKTEADFNVIGTFPRDKATNVPVNSGIEFVFNYEGAKVEDYVTFEPAIKGSFETHGKVVVFVPKSLEEKTVYTVTLKEGLPLGDSDKKLEEDMTFSFETQSEKEIEYGGYINFSSTMSEYGSDEIPSIPWDYYIYEEDVEREALVNVYAYKDVNSFMAQLDSFSEMPFWSHYSFSENKMDTKNLDKVMGYEMELSQNPDYPNFLTLPDSLEAGFYLVDVLWNDLTVQTLIQVTDLTYYYQQNDNGDLFWVNDLSTGKPVEGASIRNYADVEGTQVMTTDADGLATKVEDRFRTSQETQIYHIQKDGKQVVAYALAFNNWYYGNQNSDYFWKYFKTDRNLYQPDDTIEFFGYTKARYEDLDINQVSVEISQGGYYYWDFLPYSVDELAMVKEEVSVDNGFYSGQLKLPNLAEGYYEITVKYGDTRIATNYITVEKYVKPSYKIELEGNKKAIFVDEPIEFTVSTKFFEGTPVSKLDFNYNIGGITYDEGFLTTDINGEQVIRYTPKYQAGYQGPQYYYISAYADLPESGSIFTNSDFRVFFNDIYVEAKGEREDTEFTLKIQANDVVLDKINSGETDDSDQVEPYFSSYYYGGSLDYLGDPTQGTEITGTLYRNEWVKIENGEYYDYINKEVRKQYYYDLKTEKVDTFNLTTLEDGSAEYTFSKPVEKDVYYTAEINALDKKDRAMVQTVYFGENWEYQPRYGDYLHLELDQEKYQIDDLITATFKNGTEAYEEGKYLFTLNQNGLLKSEIVDGPVYTTDFEESFIPTASLTGVYFNGRTYITGGSESVQFDFESKDIHLDIKSDKDSYKPGDKVSLDITATTIDSNGNTVPVTDALVNISLVDEALLALSEIYIDPLNELYAYVDGYPLLSYNSHGGGQAGFLSGRGYGMDKGEAMSTDAAMDMEAPMEGAVFNEVATTFKSDDSSSIQVRSEFKDTAVFAILELNENGKASLEFTLPHNVTSWRVTGAAISNELQAGSEEVSMQVTLPFFINTSMSETYLVGDIPYIGVTAYGTELTEGESISYKVVVEDAVTGQEISSQQMDGQVFERVNLELGQFEKAGTYKVTITGLSDGGIGDGVELKVEVLDTYHTQIVSDYYSLSQGLKIATNNEGNTTLTFIDEGKGFYLPTLYRLAYSGGKRVDQKYLAYLIATLMNDNFQTDIKRDEVSITDYMVGNGGLAILPYADTEIEITVDMLPLIKDEINTQLTLMYLQNSWYNEDISEKGAILYGLAQLGEPILYDLSRYAKVEGLSDLDKMYVALAYAEFGDLYKAQEIYEEIIGENIEEFEARAYVDLGDEDENYRLTSLAMILTEKLDLPIHSKFYDYMINTYNKEYSVNPQLAEYVLHQMKEVSQESGSLSYEYNGTTVDVDLTGWGTSVKIPSATLDQFNITKVEGDLALVASYEGPLSDTVTNDDDLSVSRKYYHYQTNEELTSFNQGDIVKVVLDWNVSKDAIDNFYQLEDYVPSGLEPIDNPWQYGFSRDSRYSWFRDVDDQKVSFYIYKDRDLRYDPLVYYARVTSPGTFVAEAPIIQGTNIEDSMYIGERDIITITE